VNCVDDPSVAVYDVASLAEDAAPTTIDVRANDTDPDGATIEPVAWVSQPLSGVAAITNSGADVTYTPVADSCGVDSFSYGLDGGASATVSVTVSCSPDPSVAVNDAATLAEDAGPTTIGVRANDTDPDLDDPTIEPVTSVTQPAHGAVAITNAGADLTYTPAADYCGADSFTYTLDGGSSATVSVTVNCVDDPDTTPPDTRLIGHPKARVITRVGKAKVRFAFTSTEPRSVFRCKIDKGPFRPCGTPKTYRLGTGSHVFRVFATDAAGNRDPSPARYAFKVVRAR
jgi:hypothetical protein